MNTIAELTRSDAWAWWEARRLRYNLGLAVAGWSAYAAFWLVMFGFGDMTYIDMTAILRTTLVLGVGYLVFMAAANACYLLGVGAETLLKPTAPETFRARFWTLGFWGSCALPFLFPLVALAASVSLGPVD